MNKKIITFLGLSLIMSLSFGNSAEKLTNCNHNMNDESLNQIGVYVSCVDNNASDFCPGNNIVPGQALPINYVYCRGGGNPGLKNSCCCLSHTKFSKYKQVRLCTAKMWTN